MDANGLCYLLMAFCVGILSALCFAWVQRRSWALVPPLAAALAAAAAVTYIGDRINPAEAFDVSLTDLITAARPKSILLLLGGLAAGLGWGALAAGALRAGRAWFHAAIATVVPLVLVGIGLVMAWELAFDIEQTVLAALDPAYRIEELARIDDMPIRLALDDDGQRLFVSTYATANNGVFSGTIYALPVGPDDAGAGPRVAATSAALYRPFGLAFRGGDLYVSRAGHAAHARDGQVTYSDEGAITRLSDVDGDGQFEFYHDIVTGIPAARGPDTMHQNNGITFDAAGNLFVAVGSNSDRTLDLHDWSGTILELPAGGAEPRVFARGLRNPFGICPGPGESVFVTDNDCAEDPGDEVNFVIRGEHYGHPYQIPKTTKVRGFRDAILVGNASNYCGVAYVPDPASPADSGALYVCDRLQSAVLRLTVKREGDVCRIVDNQVFARLPMPIDIVAGRDGVLYVASISKQKLYRIRPR